MNQRRPWNVPAATDSFYYVMDGVNIIVARCWTKATAVQIVRAHNSHDALVEALNLTLAKVRQYMTFLDNQHNPDLQKVIKTADAAIAKAKPA